VSGPPNPHGIGAYATKVSDNSLYAQFSGAYSEDFSEGRQ